MEKTAEQKNAEVKALLNKEIVSAYGSIFYEFKTYAETIELLLQNGRKEPLGEKTVTIELERDKTYSEILRKLSAIKNFHRCRIGL